MKSCQLTDPVRAAIDGIRRRYWTARAEGIEWLRRIHFRLSHPGYGRRCNLCGWQGSEFYVSEDGPDRRCPTCDSLPRHRLLKHVLEQKQLPLAGSRILHVSPKGERALERWFRTRCSSYLSIDKGGAWNTRRSGAAMRQMDLTELELADGSIDFVMCSHVLECIEDDARALREIYRVLSPGGMAALPVQIYGQKTTKVLAPESEPYHHAWHPGLDYFDRYRAAGFLVEMFDRSIDDRQLLAIHDNARVPICTKPPHCGSRSRLI